MDEIKIKNPVWQHRGLTSKDIENAKKILEILLTTENQTLTRINQTLKIVENELHYYSKGNVTL